MISEPIKELDAMGYINKKIKNWYTDKEVSVLNLVTTPYNTSSVLEDLIKELINENKKVLYITNREEKSIEVLKHFKQDKSIKSYSYFRSGDTNINSHIIFTNHENAIYFNRDFDLIIYDDIEGYSNYSKMEIQVLLNFLYKYSPKIIAYSMEPIFLNSTVIEVPCFRGKYLIAEPRTISTRIDLNRDIPYIMYDYLTWFIKLKRKVIIYTPNDENANRVYEYLLALKENLNTLIHRFKGDKKDRKLEYLLKSRDIPVIVVTNYFEDYFENINNIDIIVFNADNRIFDYKKLIYFCGKVSVYNNSKGEVLLLANEVTQEMEKAKDITRKYNKLAWERGLFS
ncbi:hypothetical protein [Clostridium polynesiense]|uniref:hypothetical protein n=1 Tax=Clostridium polynesiense TaxID=1325933 RepID=UPI00069408CB|nr:hypothetical protein [Clostridium polynesiense]